MTYNDVSRNEKAISGALALATHLLFLALLVFGVTWQQKKPDSAVIVDLWNNLPPLPQPKVEESPPEVKPAPEPPKPAPKVQPKPVPKPEVKPVVKPDIALKEKQKREKELKQKELEKKKDLEKFQAKKREEEKAKAKAIRDQQAKEADAKRLAKEQDDALRKLAEQQTTQASARAKRLDEYTRRISDRIKRFIVEPPNMHGNPEVQFEVVQLPGGEVLSVRLKRSSGVAVYDNAVERAILKAQPLPPPPEGVTFNEVRELNLKIRPKE